MLFSVHYFPSLPLLPLSTLPNPFTYFASSFLLTLIFLLFVSSIALPSRPSHFISYPASPFFIPHSPHFTTPESTFPSLLTLNSVLPLPSISLHSPSILFHQLPCFLIPNLPSFHFPHFHYFPTPQFLYSNPSFQRRR